MILRPDPHLLRHERATACCRRCSATIHPKWKTPHVIDDHHRRLRGDRSRPSSRWASWPTSPTPAPLFAFAMVAIAVMVLRANGSEPPAAVPDAGWCGSSRPWPWSAASGSVLQPADRDAMARARRSGRAMGLVVYFALRLPQEPRGLAAIPTTSTSWTPTLRRRRAAPAPATGEQDLDKRPGVRPGRILMASRPSIVSGHERPHGRPCPSAPSIAPVTPLQQNCTIVWCAKTKKAAIIDPGGEVPRLMEALEDQGLTLEKIWITHGHLDHAGGTAASSRRRPACPIEGPAPGRPVLDRRHRDDRRRVAACPRPASSSPTAGWTTAT